MYTREYVKDSEQSIWVRLGIKPTEISVGSVIFLTTPATEDIWERMNGFTDCAKLAVLDGLVRDAEVKLSESNSNDYNSSYLALLDIHSVRSRLEDWFDSRLGLSEPSIG